MPFTTDYKINGWCGQVNGLSFENNEFGKSKFINCVIYYMFYTVEPLLTDTIGTSKLVLLMEVSFVNIIKYQNGTRKVSLVVRCPF